MVGRGLWGCEPMRTWREPWHSTVQRGPGCRPCPLTTSRDSRSHRPGDHPLLWVERWGAAQGLCRLSQAADLPLGWQRSPGKWAGGWPKAVWGLLGWKPKRTPPEGRRTTNLLQNCGERDTQVGGTKAQATGTVAVPLCGPLMGTLPWLLLSLSEGRPSLHLCLARRASSCPEMLGDHEAPPGARSHL